jgi:hypothetical protein
VCIKHTASFCVGSAHCFAGRRECSSALAGGIGGCGAAAAAAPHKHMVFELISVSDSLGNLPTSLEFSESTLAHHTMPDSV